MSAFTLDTGGRVLIRAGRTHFLKPWTWEDLSPFVQGYVEALLAKWRDDHLTRVAGAESVGFSDLAPEALALILRDCGAFGSVALNENNGRLFWSMRQRLERADFPPLTVYLGDDGKVHLREAGQ